VPECSNIYFCIKDKAEEYRRSRQDSLLEYKRERTRSEAILNMSSGEINHLMVNLIEKEFQIMPTDELIEQKDTERALLI